MNVIRSFYQIQNRGEILRNAVRKLDLATNEQEVLNRDLYKIKSKDYVEKQAREKLNLTREGELVVILPSLVPIVDNEPTPTVYIPNWQKWVNTFK